VVLIQADRHEVREGPPDRQVSVRETFTQEDYGDTLDEFAFGAKLRIVLEDRHGNAKELTVRVAYNMDENHVPLPPVYTIGIDAVGFVPDEEGELFETSLEGRVQNIIDLTTQSYLQLQPSYVYGYGATPDYSYVSIPTRETIARCEVPDLYWLAVFPPKMVDVIGRERLLSAPAWKTDLLENGAVLIVVYQNPRIPGDEYLPTEVEAHLRDEAE